jgi:hypothetical protein
LAVWFCRLTVRRRPNNDCIPHTAKSGCATRAKNACPTRLTLLLACYRFRFVRVRFASRAAVALIALALPAFAHHSFSAEFDGSKLIELKGTVTKIDWANPHVYFYLDVKDDKGNTANWGCEAASPGSLHRQGWNRDSLKVGDQVIVGGYPARDGSKLADARRVTLPDGRRIFGGTPGDGGPDSPKP